MILHTLISIKTVIGENNVSMTFITSLFHLPNNMSKSFGPPIMKISILLSELEKKKKIQEKMLLK